MAGRHSVERQGDMAAGRPHPSTDRGAPQASCVPSRSAARQRTERVPGLGTGCASNRPGRSLPVRRRGPGARSIAPPLDTARPDPAKPAHTLRREGRHRLRFPPRDSRPGPSRCRTWRYGAACAGSPRGGAGPGGTDAAAHRAARGRRAFRSPRRRTRRRAPSTAPIAGISRWAPCGTPHTASVCPKSSS